MQVLFSFIHLLWVRLLPLALQILLLQLLLQSLLQAQLFLRQQVQVVAPGTGNQWWDAFQILPDNSFLPCSNEPFQALGCGCWVKEICQPPPPLPSAPTHGCCAVLLWLGSFPCLWWISIPIICIFWLEEVQQHLFSVALEFLFQEANPVSLLKQLCLVIVLTLQSSNPVSHAD